MRVTRGNAHQRACRSWKKKNKKKKKRIEGMSIITVTVTNKKTKNKRRRRKKKKHLGSRHSPLLPPSGSMLVDEATRRKLNIIKLRDSGIKKKAKRERERENDTGSVS